MIVVATSDLHGHLPVIPECDLLLIAGDVSPVWNHERQFQASWLRGDFSDWLRAQPAKNIVGIGGNHDFVLDGHKQKLGYTLPWTYLNNEHTVVYVRDAEGFDTPLKIWGSALSPTFGKWANTRPEPALRDIWDTIPHDIDILLTHGPGYGICDEAGLVWKTHVDHTGKVKEGWEPEHLGSTSLANKLTYEEWPYLKLHVFGHIHEGYGETTIGGIRYLNVSRMDAQYKPINPPVVINL